MRATLALLLAVLCGCASTPYVFVPKPENDLTLKLGENEPQIERGGPHPHVDAWGHYFFSLFSKLLLLNWHIDNHNIPPELDTIFTEYLDANGLCNTKVRFNEYAPGAEWKRLVRNREMPAFWRFTLGALSVASYTIFPERLLAGFPLIGGGDHYNPYTNTISIYSGMRPVVLHEGGHAKDFSGIENRHMKGLYASLRAVPFVGLPFTLWQEAVASNDALSWELAVASSDQSKSAYRILYPAYSTYVGSSVGTISGLFIPSWWIPLAIQLGMVVPGHIAGQTRALFVEDRPSGIEPEVVYGPALAPVLSEPDPATGETQPLSRCEQIARARAAEQAVPATEPVPVTEPAPETAPVPEPAPEPAPAATPVPEPSPAIEPAPESAPEPAPAPESEPVPAPEPTPAPDAAPSVGG